MASAWGNSWGSAWGNAWGLVQAATVSVGGGGIPYQGYGITRHPWIHLPEHERKKLEVVDEEVVDLATKAVSEALEYKEEKDAEIQLAMAEKLFREKLADREWLSIYLKVLMAEIYRQQKESEEFQIAMLLFDM